MGSISLQNLSITATSPLFTDLSLVVGQGDRVGVVAGNGNGKTTLLRCIAGQAEPSSGEITRSRGLSVGFVEQDVPAALRELTLFAAVLAALPEADQETDSWRVDVVLDSFETPAVLRDRPVKELSGGWQRLMLIARVWVNEPDALLLDEPTNHLDLGKMFQLERWIKEHAQGIPMLMASHDRDFLDATTNRTLFLRPTASRYFSLPYSQARAALEEADASDATRQERELKEAKQLRKQAAKLTNIGINSGSDLLTVKSKLLKDRASKIEASAVTLHKERSGDIRLSNSGTHAKVLIAIDDVEVSTPTGQPLFRTGKLHVFQGDRIMLLGRNGTGKSQFVRLLHRAVTGTVAGIKPTATLVVGFTDQDMAQLSPKLTAREAIGAFRLGDARERSLLAGAGFPPEKQDRPISELSFGQRARLGLLVLRLSEPNFYLMDEPTNHVDIPGRERLEEELLTQGATAILVSHDRSLVRTVGTRFWEIRGKRLVEVDGPEPFLQEMAAEQGIT